MPAALRDFAKWGPFKRFYGKILAYGPPKGPTLVLDVLEIRGWGFLTGKGHGAHGLDPSVAADLQDAFGDWVVEALNAYAATGGYIMQGGDTAENSGGPQPLTTEEKIAADDRELMFGCYQGLLVLETMLKRAGLLGAADITDQWLTALAERWPEFPAMSSLRTRQFDTGETE